MLENNVQNKPQKPQFAAINPQQVSEQQVAMQAVNPELLKENIQDSYVANRVSETADDPKSYLAMGALSIPAWYGIAAGMDKFAARCRGDYETTIQHTVGDFGDRVSNNRFFQSPPMKWLNKTIKNTKNWINTNILQKTKLTKGLTYAESKPELGMVRAQAEGMLGVLAQDYTTVAENFFREATHPSSLAGYGATEAEISALEQRLKGLTGDARQLELQKAEFETLRKNAKTGSVTGRALQTETAAFESLPLADRLKKLKDLKAREIGLADFAEFEKIKAAPHEHLPRIMEASHNSNRKMYSIAYEKKTGLLGRFKRKFLNRNVYFTEISNKMAGSLGSHASRPEFQAVLNSTGLGAKIPKTLFGKGLAKFSNLFLEASTNRVAGGKLAAIAQAVYLAEVIYKSAKQDGISEKAKSFAERATEMVAFFACIPLGLKLMHKVGGLQYLGMTEQQIKDYRDALKLHTENTMSCYWGTGKAAKDAQKQSQETLRTMLKANVKNPFYKLLKKIGRIVSVGLEQIRPFDKTPVVRKTVWDKIKDLFRHPKFGLKQMAGYPMRIVLGMFIILPFLSKLCVKATHMIVGKPKNSILDEDKEKPEEVQPPAQENIPQQLQPQNTNQPTKIPQSDSNLLNQYKNGKYNPNKRANGDTNTYVPSTAPYREPNSEPVRNYVPSPMGAQIVNNEDLTEADAAMKRADTAEKLALETLKMR